MCHWQCNAHNFSCTIELWDKKHTTLCCFHLFKLFSQQLSFWPPSSLYQKNVKLFFDHQENSQLFEDFSWHTALLPNLMNGWFWVSLCSFHEKHNASLSRDSLLIPVPDMCCPWYYQVDFSCAHTNRDPAWFNETWLSRIKEESEDNWRLKVIVNLQGVTVVPSLWFFYDHFLKATFGLTRSAT